MNIRTVSISKQKRDCSRDWKLSFLSEFGCFLEAWEKSVVNRNGLGGLTKETFLAVRQTCFAVVNLVRYFFFILKIFV